MADGPASGRSVTTPLSPGASRSSRSTSSAAAGPSRAAFHSGALEVALACARALGVLLLLLADAAAAAAAGRRPADTERDDLGSLEAFATVGFVKSRCNMSSSSSRGGQSSCCGRDSSSSDESMTVMTWIEGAAWICRRSSSRRRMNCFKTSGGESLQYGLVLRPLVAFAAATALAEGGAALQRLARTLPALNEQNNVISRFWRTISYTGALASR